MQELFGGLCGQVVRNSEPQPWIPYRFGLGTAPTILEANKVFLLVSGLVVYSGFSGLPDWLGLKSEIILMRHKNSKQRKQNRATAIPVVSCKQVG